MCQKHRDANTFQASVRPSGVALVSDFLPLLLWKIIGCVLKASHQTKTSLQVQVLKKFPGEMEEAEEAEEADVEEMATFHRKESCRKLLWSSRQLCNCRFAEQKEREYPLLIIGRLLSIFIQA